MDSPNKQFSQTSTQKPIFTIQRILAPETQIEDQINRKTCIKCGVKQNQIRNCSKTIIILFDGQEQAYCDSCLEQVLIDEQYQIKKLEERFIYQKQFQASISESQIKYYGKSEQDTLDTEAINLQKQVQSLQQKQNQIDYLLGKAKNQCKQLQDKVYHLQQKQEKFWSDMNKFQKRALKLEQKSFIAKNQGQIQKKILENLSKTSVTHKFFKIQIEDNYAQVYGLVIGKKPEFIDVNWQQTNAGLGHLLLAFNYLILKYSLAYTRVENLKIKGSYSQILLRNTDTYFPVGYGVTIGSVTSTEKIFGVIMESLLAQMADLAQHIQQIENIEYSEQLKLPFSIQKKEGKILDLYVNPTKLDQKSKWSLWTKAMRYFLIDFKHILTIASLSDPYL